jgi:hypothetical protein
MTRLEALALAIAREHDALNPGSEACITLNPGMLRGYSIDKLNVVNENGVRQFNTFHAGYMALIGNLKVKCLGKTRANGQNGKLSPDSSLRDLVKSFRIYQTRNVVEFLQDVLEDRAVTESTPLSFFTDGING